MFFVITQDARCILPELKPQQKERVKLMATKLHELIAVQRDLKGQRTKTAGELRETFSKKRHLFEKKLTTFISKDEGAKAETVEQADIHTTVSKELQWWTVIWNKSIDCSYRIASSNTEAKADIVINGEKVAENVPATFLLELEKDLIELRTVLESIPTLDPAKGFNFDTNTGLYEARLITKPRTKNVKKPMTLAKATEHHPEQVTLVDENIIVGIIQEQEWSGMITPAAKAEYLDRCDSAIQAVKAARSRANEVAVDIAKKIGHVLSQWIVKS